MILSILLISVAIIIAGYALLLVWIYTKTQQECICKRCRTSIDIERIGRPKVVKTLAGFVKHKYYKCRRCHRTFFLPKGTPDTAPERLQYEDF